MLFDQRAAFRDDHVGVLHDLQLLEAVGLVQPHAVADNLQNIDDMERPVALVGAQFAVIGVIDRHQRVDAGVARRLEFRQLQLPLVGRQRAETDALQSDSRYLEIDQFHARAPRARISAAASITPATPG